MTIDLECLIDEREKVTLTVTMGEREQGTVHMWWSLVFDDRAIPMDGIFYEEDVSHFAHDLALLAENVDEASFRYHADGLIYLPDWDGGVGFRVYLRCFDRDKGLVAISGEFSRTTMTGGYGETDQAYPGFTEGQGLIVQFAGLVTERANVARLASELKRLLAEGGDARTCDAA